MLTEGLQLGHYKILKFLNGGGMGEVYQAQDLEIPRQVAIKVVQSEKKLYPDPVAAETVERLFQREMKAIAQLDHPNILPLIDFGKEVKHGSDLTYMVMPLRPDGSVIDWLHQRGNTEPLSVEDIAHLFTQAAEGLQYAHEKGIIHCDVKPANFLIRSRNDRPTRPDLQLADFGIAKIAETSKSSTTTRGTVAYMSPEQLSGHAVPASDQYSLAIMGYELLTGSLPFAGQIAQLMYQHMHEQAKPPSSINPLIPKALDAVILRGMAKKPQDRFPSIKAFGEAFLQAAMGLPQGNFNEKDSIPDPKPWVDTVPVLPLPQPKPITARKSVSVGSAVVLCLIIFAFIAGGIGIAYGATHSNQQSLSASSIGDSNTTITATASNKQANADATVQAQSQANADATVQAQSQANADATAQAQSQANADATAQAQNQANADATAQAQNQANADATATAAAQPQCCNIAGIHNGTLYNTSVGQGGYLSLNVQQNQQSIRGYCNISGGLAGSGNFTGTIDSSGAIQFTVQDTTQVWTLYFVGQLYSDGSMQGKYSVTDAYGNTQYGVWKTN